MNLAEKIQFHRDEDLRFSRLAMAHRLRARRLLSHTDTIERRTRFAQTIKGSGILAAEFLGINPNAFYNRLWNYKQAAVTSLILLFLSFGFTASAQNRGSFNLLPTPPSAKAIAVHTNKTPFLTWDSDQAKFAVYTGPSRRALVKRFVTETNRIALAATNYGIAAISAQGVESALAYWPSNRIGEIRLSEQGRTNFTVLERFTNAPAAPVRLWRVADITVGYE